MSSTSSPARTSWQQSVPQLAVAGLALLIGLFEVAQGVFAFSRNWPVLIVACLVVATALSRRLPSVALALVWVAFWVQMFGGVELMVVELAVAVVAFGCARWGSTGTVVASLASAPLAAAVFVVLLGLNQSTAMFARQSGITQVLYAVRNGRTLSLSVVVFVLATSVPWLAGLALRFSDRAQSSQVSQRAAEGEASRAVLDRQQAQEIAQLRENQAQLARDVHDVVGHSLAVILAQAEAGQYLPDEQPAELKRTLATIATSARTSLRDVRQVLAVTTEPTVPPETDLDALVEGVRSSGHEVTSSQVGAPQPLPPELATVAYRVLQEMLTNAIRHGRRALPISVERHWEGELRLEVQNVIEGTADETGPVVVRDAGGGQGVEGMRRRLEAVGGRLDVRRRTQDGVATFTATAWVPVRAGARR